MKSTHNPPQKRKPLKGGLYKSMLEVKEVKGTVKFFDNRKNFGFITPDEGDEDLFVHRSDIESDSLFGSPIDEGDKVEFETEESEKGPRAVKVKKI